MVEVGDGDVDVLLVTLGELPHRLATKGYRIDCPSEGGAAMTTGLGLALAGGALVWAWVHASIAEWVCCRQDDERDLGSAAAQVP